MTKIQILFSAEKQTDFDRINQFFLDEGLKTEFKTKDTRQKSVGVIELFGCVLNYISAHPTLVPHSISALINSLRFIREYRDSANPESLEGMWLKMTVETENETKIVDPRNIDEFIEYLENQLPDDLAGSEQPKEEQPGSGSGPAT